MSRLLKIILSIFASVALLVIIAAIALPLLLNPNDFKPEIQAAVKDNLGRDLQIEGELELSVFPWIGISTGKMTLSNAEGFSDKPFAEIESSNVKVKLLPLLSKEVEVNRVVLKGLTLNLAKNKKGISNWDDLAGSSQDSGDKAANNDTTKDKSASPLAALAIGGIAIEQAKIVWDDQQQQKYVEINDFNFKTGKLAFDKAIDIDLSLSVLNKQPALTEQLTFSTALVINKNLNQFKLQDIQLKSTTRGDGMPESGVIVSLLANVALDIPQQTVELQGLVINSGEMNLSADISGTQIKDSPVFKGPIKIAEFNLAKLMKSMAMPLPEMQASDALTKVSLAFDLSATKSSAEIKQLKIALDNTSIKGSANVVNFSQPKVAFNINIDEIDVDRYLAPIKKDVPKKGVSNKVITPASAAVAGASLFPVETLRALNAKGQLSIDQLKINQLNMQGLSLNLNAKNGLINTQQKVKQLYQGNYTGNTSINVKNKTPAIALDEKLNNVNIEPLLKDMNGENKMSGVVNASAKINGRGNSTAAIKSSLNGNINFNFKDGVIKGFNLQKIIDSGKSLLEGTPLPTENKQDQTVFSIIKGTAKIKNGLLSNNDLYAEASKLRVNGKGSANIANEKLDYKVNAKLLRRLATETEPEKINGVPLVINVGGSFSKPTYTLDIAAMLVGKNRAKIDKKIDKVVEKLKLDEKLGPGINNLIKGLF